MSLTKIETVLDETLGKKAPIQLPPNGRKMLAGALWWIALVSGVLQLLAAYMLWQAGHRADELVDYANALNNYVGAPVAAVEHLGPFYYLSLLTMATVAVILLLASPALKAMKKDGWNMLFYAVLVQAVSAFFLLFAGYYGGVGNFLGAAFGAVVGAYLLFQVREHFMHAKSTHPKSDVPADKS